MTAKKTSETVEQASAPKPATEFDPAGAPIQSVSDVDPTHPAVDNNPRAGTSSDQNRIDFNDPALSSEETVAKNLGMTAEAEQRAED